MSHRLRWTPEATLIVDTELLRQLHSDSIFAAIAEAVERHRLVVYTTRCFATSKKAARDRELIYEIHRDYPGLITQYFYTDQQTLDFRRILRTAVRRREVIDTEKVITLLDQTRLTYTLEGATVEVSGVADLRLELLTDRIVERLYELLKLPRKIVPSDDRDLETMMYQQLHRFTLDA